MKTLLIIYPHWPPSNLAGVHRPRLVANFLPNHGWQPVVLTVDEKYYEEPLDPDMLKTVAGHVEVVKTESLSVIQVMGKRVIGDIGIRAFGHLYREAKAIIQSRKIDFIWIPIPSWYTSILGRLLFQRYRIPYGIDYIDPWVSQLAPHHKTFSRAWLARLVALLLEPIAVHKASLLSGVATPYYQGVLDRNFKTRPIAHVGMPYGFDPNDHRIPLTDIDYPWSCEATVRPFVYAGAFLPQSHLFVRCLFQAMANLVKKGEWAANTHFYFLGTGHYGGTTIAEYANRSGVSHLVTEVHERYPFLHIQQFLRDSAGVLILGSTEKHYTASKTFQCLLSGRPIWTVLHAASSAADIIKACSADQFSTFYEENTTEEDLITQFEATLSAFVRAEADLEWQPDLAPLSNYTADRSAKMLVDAIEGVIMPVKPDLTN